MDHIDRNKIDKMETNRKTDTGLNMLVEWACIQGGGL